MPIFNMSPRLIVCSTNPLPRIFLRTHAHTLPQTVPPPRSRPKPSLRFRWPVVFPSQWCARWETPRRVKRASWSPRCATRTTRSRRSSTASSVLHSHCRATRRLRGKLNARFRISTDRYHFKLVTSSIHQLNIFHTPSFSLHSSLTIGANLRRAVLFIVSVSMSMIFSLTDYQE